MAECDGTELDRELGRFARLLYRERRQRDALLNEGLFGEAAWDILLDLFASWSEGKSVRISSACIAAAVPATTALRYLSELEKRGLLERIASSTDRRSQYVRLTREAQVTMRGLLSRYRSAREGLFSGEEI